MLISFLNIAFAFKPTVDVTLSNRHLIPGEKLKIEIEVVAPKKSKIVLPKINSIHGFKVQKKIKNSIINANDKGKVIELKDIIATYTLKPKSDLIVGPFTILVDNNPIKTKSYKVTIIKNQAPTPQKIEKIKKPSLNFTQPKLIASINKKETFIGDQFIITYQLIRPRNLTLSHSEFKIPNFINFNAYQLHEPRTIIKNDRVITIYQYILVPKKAGNLTILPASFKYSLNLIPQVQNSFDIFSQGRNFPIQVKELVSNSLQVHVKAIPANVDAIGLYKMSIKLNKFSVEANKPLEFTLEIVGEGDLHLLQLPNMQIDGVTLFPKKPIIKEEFRNNKLFTILIQKYVYIASEDYTLPPISLKIFNPYEKKIYFLKSQAIKIKVTKALSLNSILHQTPKEKQKEEKILFDMNYYKKELQNCNNNFLQFLLTYILGVITGVLGTIYLPILIELIKNRGKTQNIFQNYEEAFNILYPHTTESAEIEEMVKRLYEVINGNNEIQIDNKALNKMIKKVLKKE